MYMYMYIIHALEVHVCTCMYVYYIDMHVLKYYAEHGAVTAWPSACIQYRIFKKRTVDVFMCTVYACSAWSTCTCTCTYNLQIVGVRCLNSHLHMHVHVHVHTCIHTCIKYMYMLSSMHVSNVLVIQFAGGWFCMASQTHARAGETGGSVQKPWLVAESWQREYHRHTLSRQSLPTCVHALYILCRYYASNLALFNSWWCTFCIYMYVLHMYTCIYNVHVRTYTCTCIYNVHVQHVHMYLLAYTHMHAHIYSNTQ